MKRPTSKNQRCSQISGRLSRSFVYLVVSKAQTDKPALIYAGMTSRSLKRRLAEHNDQTRKGYTAKRGPWSLLAARAFLSPECALIAERQLKRSKFDKRNWIKRIGRLRTLCDRHGIQHPLARN